MLTIQYRMHPLIRAFPSKKYYEDKLTDGSDVLNRKLDPELSNIASSLTRSVFFDLTKSRENEKFFSKCNYNEVDFTLALLTFLVKLSGHSDF
jgi:senataxin